MTSVNTNAAAITALRTLQQTNNSLDATQARISTGLKIGEAKDNAAYWAISTTLKSDNESLGTVKDALGLGAATVDVAYQGLNKAKDVLDEIKAKLTAATQPGVDRDVIQAEIGELQKQLVSIASSSVFSGENWLSVDSSTVNYDATKKIVASFSRDTNNSVSIGTVDVSIGNVALFDASTVPGTNGILDTMQSLTDKSGVALTNGGIAETTGNTNAAGLATAAGTSNGTIGAAGSNNTAVATGAAAGSAAVGTVGAATGASAGIAATRTEAADFSAITGTTDSGSPSTDKLVIGMTIDGVTKTINVSNANGVDSITLDDIVAAINDTTNGYGAGKASKTGNKLTLTGGTAGATLNVSINSLSVTGATGTPAYTGLTTTGAATGTPSAATSGSLVKAMGAGLSSLASGDTVEISYTLANGTSATSVVTLTGAITNATDLAAAFNAGSTTNKNGVTAANAAGSIRFTDAGTTGTGSNFTLNDVVVKSSTGVVKNVDVIGAFTESLATSVSTGSLTWTDVAGGKVTLGLNNGAALAPVTVDAGANLAAFVTNLNANATFNAAFRASVTGGSSDQLLITRVGTGAGAASITSVAFGDSTGAPKSVSTSGFGNLATSATRTTADFSTFTLDSNDTLNLSVQVGTGTAKAVKIDQALVNATLGASAAGAVTTAADFKRVVDAAMTAAGVTGVTTALGTAPADVNKLVFTGTLGQSLTIAGGTASQGGMAMSVDKLDISDTGLAARGVTTSADIQKVLSAYISVVNTAINKVTTAASNLGAVASRIDMQKSFVNTLMDTIDKGVGGLIDADMLEESTKLQALQVKQQLGVQALSIANQSAQSVLSLFRG